MASHMPDPDVSGCGIVVGPIVGALAFMVAGFGWACYWASIKWPNFAGWTFATYAFGFIAFGLFCVSCYITFYGLWELFKQNKPVRPS